MKPYPKDIREEELKNRVRTDFFVKYDPDAIIGNVDFAVGRKQDAVQLELYEKEYYLWAECKRGTNQNIYHSLVQLIITIGKARTFDRHLPPNFLGAFDAEKMAFIPYEEVSGVFYQNDFNWNVTPSDHETKEFQQVLAMVQSILDKEMLLYYYDKDEAELRKFIAKNFITGTGKVSKVHITKTNFITIYQRWAEEVKPTIAVDWEIAKKENILSADFYLADILSHENQTLKDKLRVLLQGNRYEMDGRFDKMGLWQSASVAFKDKQVAHTQFWNRYHRPPKEDYWDYIVERRDLLVPQDVRERKGSYFTPQKWVALSQEYLEKELGEDWQDEYYIWDCCAGTGNLLNGLSNKYNIWASTLDQADVDVMKERIANGANLLDSHVFQFDFLNDDFSKLPQGLQDIINDEEKRKKLVVYINPPYAEAGDSKQLTGTGKNKIDVAVTTATYKKYLPIIGIAGREVFSQFFIRIYQEIPSCVLAEFSTLKILQAPNFGDFRRIFRAKLGRLFLVPANTFDNVKGQFPIGFFIWHTQEEALFDKINADVYSNTGEYLGEKSVVCYDNEKGNIGKWVSTFKDGDLHIGFMSNGRNDFQNQKLVYIMNDRAQMPTPRGWWITEKNLIIMSIFLSVRHCIEATWLNDRDQFLFPNEGWKADKEFQSDCLAFTLFNNNIQAQYGTNHWIPFREQEVEAKEKFASNFMANFIAGKLKSSTSRDAIHCVSSEVIEGPEVSVAPAGIQTSIFTDDESNTIINGTEAIVWSAEAQAVMNAGRELWKYYHAQANANPDAAFYDIRLYFQGTKTTASGKVQMNTKSEDAHYTELISDLRAKLRTLADKIAEKVYAYGFLK